MIRLGRVAPLIVIAGLLGNCGDSSGPPDLPTYTVNDPSGDTFGDSTYQPDVTRLSIRRDTAGFDVIIEFAAPVVSPMVSTKTGVYGFIDFDTDQESLTGSTSYVDLVRSARSIPGSTGMGVDYYVSSPFDADSTVGIRRHTPNAQTARTKPRYEGNRLTVRVPTAALDGYDGPFHVAIVFGTGPDASDIVPNNGFLLVGAGPVSPASAATETRKASQ